MRKFFMTFARIINKMPEFYMMFARKICFQILFFWGGGNDPPAPSPTPIIGTVSYRPDWMYNYCYNNYYATVIGTTGLPRSISRPWSIGPAFSALPED